MKNRQKLRAMRTLCLLLLLSLAGTASAGNLYRCLGSDGIPNYTSRKIAGSACTVVAKNSPTPIVSAPVAIAPAATTSAAEASSAVAVANTVAQNSAGSKGTPKFLRMGSSTTYSYVDANGVRNYSNYRPKGVAVVTVSRVEYPIFSQPSCYACGLTPWVNFGSVRLNTQAYAAEIKAAANAYGVEEALVRAIIHAESAYRPNVQSNKGAQGLMQLIPATAKRFGVSNSFDPAQNINGGVQYLSWLMRRYQKDTTLAAAAYNAGEGAVDRYGGVPPYKETQLYVARVGQLAERYRKAL